MSHGDDFGSPYGGRGGDYDYGDDPAGGRRGTRTRLHDDDSFGSGSRRPRPTASPRSLMTVVGVVVLLIAAIAFANRGGSSDDSSPKSDSNPTAASGDRPAKSGSAGVPAGFAKTQRGAQSAAANYAVALGGTGMFDSGQRRAIVQAVYAPQVADQRMSDLDKVYSGKDFLQRIGLNADGKPPSGTTFVSRTNPVGTKVDKFSGDSATVSVWYSSLFGLAGKGSTNPVAESWYTNTFQLRWTKGDWKVADFTQKDGPTPVGRDQRASSAEDMSNAVERFGGFTYAR